MNLFSDHIRAQCFLKRSASNRMKDSAGYIISSRFKRLSCYMSDRTDIRALTVDSSRIRQI